MLHPETAVQEGTPKETGNEIRIYQTVYLVGMEVASGSGNALGQTSVMSQG